MCGAGRHRDERGRRVPSHRRTAGPFVSRGDSSGTHVNELALWLHRGGAPESCAVGITELMQEIRTLLPCGDQVGGSEKIVQCWAIFWCCRCSVHTLPVPSDLLTERRNDAELLPRTITDRWGEAAKFSRDGGI